MRNDILQKEFCKGITPFAIIAVRKNDAVGNIIRFFEQGFSDHIALYIGNKQNLIVEATPRKAVNFADMKKFLNKDYEVKVYENLSLTAKQIELLKDETYRTMATTDGYSFLGVLSFIFPWIKPKGNEKYCSQTATNLYYKALFWRIFPTDTEIEKASPSDIVRFMESEEAKSQNWICTRYWNKGECFIY